MTTATARPDHGHEPWARAAIDRGAGLTVEQGRELLATIDTLRKRVETLAEEKRQLVVVAQAIGEAGRSGRLYL